MWSRNLWCVAVIFILIPVVFSIKITEVELNPSGSDSGFEWIEIYNNNDIGNYTIINNDGDGMNITIQKGYFVYELEKQWLDNSNERVFLYKDDELIDETDVLKDSLNDDNTNTYCDSWELKKSTKGKENECDDSNSISNETSNINNNESDNKIDEMKINEDKKNSDYNRKNITYISNENISNTIKQEPKVIYLKAKNIKTSENKQVLFESSNEKIKKYMIYVFAFFCIIMIILLMIDKR